MLTAVSSIRSTLTSSWLVAVPVIGVFAHLERFPLLPAGPSFLHAQSVSESVAQRQGRAHASRVRPCQTRWQGRTHAGRCTIASDHTTPPSSRPPTAGSASLSWAALTHSTNASGCNSVAHAHARRGFALGLSPRILDRGDATGVAAWPLALGTPAGWRSYAPSGKPPPRNELGHAPRRVGAGANTPQNKARGQLRSTAPPCRACTQAPTCCAAQV